DPGPRGEAACYDTASLIEQGTRSFKAVLTPGQTWVGVRDLQGPSNHTSFSWHNLTDPTAHPGYPDNACGVTISQQTESVAIDVVTTDGEVFETWCRVINADPADPTRDFELDCVTDPGTANVYGPWVHKMPNPTVTDPP
ncbi:hypothetical protein ABZY81_43380, partial [Streptomyces sp. NPDC006514]